MVSQLRTVAALDLCEATRAGRYGEPLMAALFNPPSLPSIPPPPPMPMANSAAVSKAGNDAVKARANAQGRASTVLTNPGEQTTPDKSRQRYLGMA